MMGLILETIGGATILTIGCWAVPAGAWVPADADQCRGHPPFCRGCISDLGSGYIVSERSRMFAFP